MDNKTKEMKLAIYEIAKRENLSKDDLSILLEKVNERYILEELEIEPLTEDEELCLESVLEGLMSFTEAFDSLYDEEFVEESEDGEASSAKAMSVNKTYISAMKSATASYKSGVIKAKESIRKGEYDKASKEIEDAKQELLKCKKLVDETPSSITDNAIAASLGFIKAATVVAVMIGVFKLLSSSMSKYDEKKKEQMKEDLKERKKALNREGHARKEEHAEREEMYKKMGKYINHKKKVEGSEADRLDKKVSQAQGKVTADRLASATEKRDSAKYEANLSDKALEILEKDWKKSDEEYENAVKRLKSEIQSIEKKMNDSGKSSNPVDKITSSKEFKAGKKIIESKPGKAAVGVAVAGNVTKVAVNEVSVNRYKKIALKKINSELRKIISLQCKIKKLSMK